MKTHRCCSHLDIHYDPANAIQRFAVRAALLLAIAVLSESGLAQTITNGAYTTNTLVVNTTNTYSFDASDGDRVLLRMGTLSFNPRIDLYNPSGTHIASGFITSSGGRDAELAPVALTNTGNFTVQVSSYYANGSGFYRLTLAKSPGVFVVSPGDEGGAMTNGYQHAGMIDVGDLDLWSFSANAGDRVVLRMGATGFNPQLRLFGPDGVLRAEAALGSSGGRDTEISPTLLTNSGNYTVVANSYYANGNGAYILTLAKSPGAFEVSPGDEGGAMTNGYQHSGMIDIGDLDLWSFSANAGDRVVLRMGTTGYSPHLRLFGPTGVLRAEAANGASGGRDTEITPTLLTNSGNYTVVANSYYANGNGAYILTLAKSPGAFEVSPGDEGGAMTNGYQHVGTIDIGDLDLWSFSANAGDRVVLRMGTTAYNPHLRIFGPTGILRAEAVNGASGGRDTEIPPTLLTNSGNYTVVANAYYANGNGDYILTLAHIPGSISIALGDEGGSVTNGFQYTGTINVGDLDVWSIPVCGGSHLSITYQEVTGGTGFTPRLRLFAPNGVPLATNQNATLAVINYAATQSGRYTLITDGASFNNTGTYNLTVTGVAEDGFKLCPPYISGGVVEVTGIGGMVGATGILFTTTNVTTSLPLWTPLLTNQIDVFGTFVYTNSFNPAETQRYFILQSN